MLSDKESEDGHEVSATKYMEEHDVLDMENTEAHNISNTENMQSHDISDTENIEDYNITNTEDIEDYNFSDTESKDDNDVPDFEEDDHEYDEIEQSPETDGEDEDTHPQVAVKRKASSTTNLAPSKRIRLNIRGVNRKRASRYVNVSDNETTPPPITHHTAREALQMIDNIIPTLKTGKVDLGPEQHTLFTRTGDKSDYLKQKLKEVSPEALPQARRDRQQMLKATKSMNQVGKVRLAEDINAKAPWKVKGMKSTLRDHQVIAAGTMVAWECRDSTFFAKGGILGDEMGLGKTVEALALIALHRPSQKDIADGRTTTLVICPAGITRQWFDMTRQHGDDLTVHLYKASETWDTSIMRHINILVTSYHEVVGALPPVKKKDKKGKNNYKFWRRRNLKNRDVDNSDSEVEIGPPGFLLQAKFFRVICDEAHAFKNWESKTFRAINRIDTKHRWAMSGTPITNTLAELYPYFKWLDMPCARSRSKFVTQFCESKNDSSRKRLQTILSQSMIRRTMGSRLFDQPIVWLPVADKMIEDVELYPQERVFYRYLEDRFMDMVRKWDEKGELNHNRRSALEMILRLRQIASHIALAQKTVKTFFDYGDLQTMRGTLDKIDPRGDRQIMDKVASWIIEAEKLRGHTAKNVGVSIKRELDDFEALADTDPDKDLSKVEKGKDIPWLSAQRTLLRSAKLDMIEHKLSKIFASRPTEKVVVFTQFLTMASTIAKLCDDNGWTYVKYTGGTGMKARNNIVNDFQKDDGPQVLISSLKAGGQGLTLTNANHAFCCEMWWNSACDLQAFCRIYRIGQDKLTYFTRLKATRTIDEVIALLQDQKDAEISGAITDGKPYQKITLEEILAAFKSETRFHCKSLAAEVIISDDEED